MFALRVIEIIMLVLGLVLARKHRHSYGALRLMSNTPYTNLLKSSAASSYSIASARDRTNADLYDNK